MRAKKIYLRGGNAMPVLFALAGSALADFAEGCLLGASVYLVSRGAKEGERR